MDIKKEIRGDVLVLAPAGSVDSSGAGDLHEMIESAILDGSTRIVFDLSRAEYVSIDGLKVILNAGRKLRTTQGEIAVAALQGNVHSLFRMSGFLAVFNAYLTVDESIEAIR